MSLLTAAEAPAASAPWKICAALKRFGILDDSLWFDHVWESGVLMRLLKFALVLLASSTAFAQAGRPDASFRQPPPAAIARSTVDKLRDIVNVKDFGAKCDGVTDDRVAIQSAITAAASGTFALDLPPGNCLIGTTGLTFPVRSMVTLRGRGSSGGAAAAGGTRIVYTGTGTAIQIGGSGSGPAGAISWFALENIIVDVSGSSSSTANGIVVYNTRGGLIANSMVLGTQAGAGVVKHWGISLWGGARHAGS